MECMWHVVHMSTMIQVRNVPSWLHRELVRRAKMRGETLTQYVQRVLERDVARPPAEQVFARIRSRRRVRLGGTAAAVIRGERSKRSPS